MKKSVIKKLGFLFGMMFIAVSTISTTNASAADLDNKQEIEVDYPYELVSGASCSLTISSGNANVSSAVDGRTGTTSTTITVYLEKLVYGTWQPYTSWTHNGGRNQNNTDSISVGSGAFRVWMSVTATNSNGVSESFNVDGNVAGY